MENAIRNPSPVVVEQEEVTTTSSPFWDRTSFTAILSGVAVALVLQFALNLLGISIGASTIDPMTEQNPVGAALGTTALLWISGSTLISLFVGGYIASHLSGTVDQGRGVLQGLATWAIAALISISLLGSTVGAILSTAANLLGQGLNAAGGTIAELAPEVADAVNLQDIRFDAIREEAMAFMNTGQPATNVTPSTNTEDATTTENGTTATTTNNATVEPSPLEREVDLTLARILLTPATNENQAATNREALVNLLVERGNMTPEEAQTTVAEWESNFEQIRVAAEDAARQAGQALADAVAVAAGFAFLMMGLGAAAAGFGGFVGADEATMIRRRFVKVR